MSRGLEELLDALLRLSLVLAKEFRAPMLLLLLQGGQGVTALEVSPAPSAPWQWVGDGLRGGRT